ncbi:interleukin-15 receptor subunit alpha isoform X3 [Bufo gargarizans]|uniref:interleukin-15 receptor subunit alpha isoform X3 n=1 Tax=Bufo gargarizans TaxID=30331 RepID=UPI001CF0F752|nr:interleukin-15 receptor subunit alpha isoform X3 [Bufo gargarizans]
MARALITTISPVLLMMVIVLQMSLSADSNQVCSVPKRVKNVKMNLFSESYEVNSHLRYVCEDGYKRQAGTSNLAICQFNDKTKKADWKYGNISCIRDPSIATTAPINTKSPFTTSESRPSRVSTSSSTTVERFTIISSTVQIHETLHTTQAKATQTQLPGHTPMIRLSTTYEHTTPGQTFSPGLQFITQTLFPKDTGRTVSEQTTVSTTAAVMEKTVYTATVKQSTAAHLLTPVQSTSPPDPQTSIWQKTETIAAAGSVVVIIPLVGVIILVVYCRKRRNIS